MSSGLTMSEPTLNWDVSPKNGLKTFFSQENYKDHSMAPSLRELYILSNRCAGESLNASASSPHSHAAASSAPHAKERVGMILLPKPRVPYPRFSRFSQREQRTYVDLLAKYAKITANSKAIEMNKDEYLQYLDMKKHVSEEVTEFLKFLQNSAKKCSQDYHMLSEDARLATEQMLRARNEQVKKYPEFYALHEVTSLMGFFPFRTEMGLKLEKTLLVLGSAKFVKTALPSMPVKLQLSKDDTSFETAQRKAEAMHSDISKDPNAEKLVSRYRPQIALTSQSLFTLLNNHGPSYKEQWEIPVCVQMMPVAGSKPVKVIYINSPLPRKQMTMRERNQIFHEVSLKCMVSKATSVPVSAVFMDKPEEYTSEMEASSEVNECRKTETHENLDMDFDDDVTELETFGVTTTCPSRSPTPPNTSPAPATANAPPTPVMADAPPAPATTDAPKATAVSLTPTTPVIADDSRSLCQILMKQLQKEKQLFCGADSSQEGRSRHEGKEAPCHAGASRHDAAQLGSAREAADTSDSGQGSATGSADPSHTAAEATKGGPWGSDTDEDCLVIDTELKGHGGGGAADGGCRTAGPQPSGQPSVGRQATPGGRPEESCVLKKPIKRVYKKFDPVGEILKMQDELLKPVSKKAPELPLMNLEDSKQLHASEQPCAASDATSWPKCTWPSAFQKPRGRLPYELQDHVEDASEYVAPQEGNRVYKLFSLQELLLLVRCSVQRTETRPRSKKRKKIRRQFPVFVLPKVEYQGCYGVEALTDSELCRLWTESLLHSNCSFYVGHIDAFTSKLFLLEEITAEELKEKLPALKISSLFNILQHILKKLNSLQEGSYLLSHAAQDSSLLIYKTSDGKVTRTAYNLHKAHGDLPGVPSSLSVPWVPLDPSCLLPYHIHHGRIPCTFPPKPLRPVAPMKVGGVKMPAAPGHRNPVPMETTSCRSHAEQAEKEGVAPNKRKLS